MHAIEFALQAISVRRLDRIGAFFPESLSCLQGGAGGVGVLCGLEAYPAAFVMNRLPAFTFSLRACCRQFRNLAFDLIQNFGAEFGFNRGTRVFFGAFVWIDLISCRGVQNRCTGFIEGGGLLGLGRVQGCGGFLLPPLRCFKGVDGCFLTRSWFLSSLVFTGILDSFFLFFGMEG